VASPVPSQRANEVNKGQLLTFFQTTHIINPVAVNRTLPCRGQQVWGPHSPLSIEISAHAR
jgi:hypothetical protein